MRVLYDTNKNFFNTSSPLEKKLFENELTIMLNYMRSSGSVIQEEFKSEMALEINLNYPKFFNALVDSFYDIRRIADFHPLNKRQPDQVKLASHVAFWFIRWQPCSINPQDDFLESNLTKKEKKKLLFINETLMVNYLISNVFKGGEIKCKVAPDESMKEWEGYYEYLFYYLSYRLRSPKELEAILKSITLHPVFKVHNNIHFRIE